MHSDCKRYRLLNHFKEKKEKGLPETVRIVRCKDGKGLFFLQVYLLVLYYLLVSVRPEVLRDSLWCSSLYFVMRYLVTDETLTKNAYVILLMLETARIEVHAITFFSSFNTL